jgi:hypothetical protein
MFLQETPMYHSATVPLSETCIIGRKLLALLLGYLHPMWRSPSRHPLNRRASRPQELASHDGEEKLHNAPAWHETLVSNHLLQWLSSHGMKYRRCSDCHFASSGAMFKTEGRNGCLVPVLVVSWRWHSQLIRAMALLLTTQSKLS